MKCNRCGYEMDENVSICDQCGEVAEEIKHDKKVSAKKLTLDSGVIKNKLPIIIFVLCFLVIAIICLRLLITKDLENRPAWTQQEETKDAIVNDLQEGTETSDELSKLTEVEKSYMMGLEAYENEQYEDALTYFKKAHGTKDSKEYLETIEEKMAEEKEGRFLFEDSDKRYITVEELQLLPREQRQYARYEIYARHNVKFNSSYLVKYFEAKPWYNGETNFKDFEKEADNILNEYEQANIKLIRNYE